jgi:hypothetical protein
MNGLSRKQLALLVVCLPLLALVVVQSLWHGLSAAWGDSSSLEARWVVSQWRLDKGPAMHPDVWVRTRDSLRSALTITPHSAQLFDDLAYLHATRAVSIGNPDPATPLGKYQAKLFDDAIVYFRRGADARPTYPFSWAYLALTKDMRGQVDDELWLAFDKAIRFGSTEAAVRTAVVQIACTHWDTLNATRQQAVVAMVASTPADARNKLLDYAASRSVALQ